MNRNHPQYFQFYREDAEGQIIQIRDPNNLWYKDYLEVLARQMGDEDGSIFSRLKKEVDWYAMWLPLNRADRNKLSSILRIKVKPVRGDVGTQTKSVVP